MITRTAMPGVSAFFWRQDLAVRSFHPLRRPPSGRSASPSFGAALAAGIDRCYAELRSDDEREGLLVDGDDVPRGIRRSSSAGVGRDDAANWLEFVADLRTRPSYTATSAASTRRCGSRRRWPRGVTDRLLSIRRHRGSGGGAVSQGRAARAVPETGGYGHTRSRTWERSKPARREPVLSLRKSESGGRFREALNGKRGGTNAPSK